MELCRYNSVYDSPETSAFQHEPYQSHVMIVLLFMNSAVIHVQIVKWTENNQIHQRLSNDWCDNYNGCTRLVVTWRHPCSASLTPIVHRSKTIQCHRRRSPSFFCFVRISARWPRQRRSDPPPLIQSQRHWLFLGARFVYEVSLTATAQF